MLDSAAAEKLSVILDQDFLEYEAKLGLTKDFEDYLAAVPDADPIHPDDVIEE